MSIRLKKFYYRHKLFSITAILLLVLLVFYAVISFIPFANKNLSTKSTSNLFSSQKSLVYAQKSQSEQLNNTILYYKNILENNNDYSVDGFEITVFLSKDNRIIVSSYDNLDKFSDSNYAPFYQKNVKISQKTVGELKQYNIAYNIKVNNKYPYRDIDADLTYARIITIDELIDYLKTQSEIWKKQFKLIINIGDNSNYLQTIDALNDTLQILNYQDYCVVVANTNANANMLNKYPLLNRTATYTECFSFYFDAITNNKSAKISYQLLYTNSWQFPFRFAHKSIVDYAKFCGVPIIFKDINDNKNIPKIAQFAPNGIAGTNPKQIYINSI